MCSLLANVDQPCYHHVESHSVLKAMLRNRVRVADVKKHLCIVPLMAWPMVAVERRAALRMRSAPSRSVASTRALCSRSSVFRGVPGAASMDSNAAFARAPCAR